MTLPFGGTRCGTKTSPIGQSQHQHLRLIGTHHLAQVACSLICSQCNNSHVDCAKCCVRINRKCWCCDQPICDVLIAHRVSPKCSVITVEWRLTTYTCFEIKIFKLLDGFSVSMNTSLECQNNPFIIQKILIYSFH